VLSAAIDLIGRRFRQPAGPRAGNRCLRPLTIEFVSVSAAPDTFCRVGEVGHGSGNRCSTVSWDLINDAAEVASTSFGDGTHSAPPRVGQGEGNLPTIGGRDAALHQAGVDEPVDHPGCCGRRDVKSGREPAQVRLACLEYDEHPKLRQSDTADAGNRSRRERHQGSRGLQDGIDEILRCLIIGHGHSILATRLAGFTHPMRHETLLGPDHSRCLHQLTIALQYLTVALCKS
jgi:hypothetical protein